MKSGQTAIGKLNVTHTGHKPVPSESGWYKTVCQAGTHRYNCPSEGAVAEKVGNSTSCT